MIPFIKMKTWTWLPRCVRLRGSSIFEKRKSSTFARLGGIIYSIIENGKSRTWLPRFARLGGISIFDAEKVGLDCRATSGSGKFYFWWWNSRTWLQRFARLGGSSFLRKKVGLNCRASRDSDAFLSLKMKKVELDCRSSRGFELVLFW